MRSLLALVLFSSCLATPEGQPCKTYATPYECDFRCVGPDATVECFCKDAFCRCHKGHFDPALDTPPPEAQKD